MSGNWGSFLFSDTSEWDFEHSDSDSSVELGSCF